MFLVIKEFAGLGPSWTRVVNPWSVF
uniref:Uncharacterized protein n=1 Tax=Anguilla anguilla TaxID=7936 RepID=A0A0E9V8F8_ANGAN